MIGQTRPKEAPFGGGLDKLELRIPCLTPFRKEFGEMCRARMNGEVRGKMKTSQHYVAVLDLRPEHNALLHYSNRHNGPHDHKLEFLETGSFGMSQIIGGLEQIVDTEPMSLETMRTDLTVDLERVPVSYFLRHSLVAHKRFHAEIGSTPTDADYQLMGTRGVSTIYAGKRPNCYRVYDKTEKWRSDYARFVGEWFAREHTRQLQDRGVKLALIKDGGLDSRRRNPMLPQPPSFEEKYGVPPTHMLTRVERQCGAQQIPKLHDGKLRSMAMLRNFAPDFNPFQPMSFSLAGREVPSPHDRSLRDHLAGMYLRQLIESEGYGPTIAKLRLWDKNHEGKAGGHLKSLLQKFEPYNPCAELGALASMLEASEYPVVGVQGARVTEEQLYEQYRSAIRRQFAA